jgi:hypothetical protein
MARFLVTLGDDNGQRAMSLLEARQPRVLLGQALDTAGA